MTTPSQNDRAAINRLSEQLVSMQADIDMLKRSLGTPRLAHSSIEDGYLQFNDADGNPRLAIGRTPDGTFAPIHGNGPPPPTPSAPGVTPILGGLDAYWDGTFIGAAKPNDFSHVLIYCSPDGPGFVVSDANLFGSLQRGGTHPVVPLEAVEHWVKLVAVSTSGVESDPSPASSAVPEEAVAGEILDGAVTEIKLADDAVTQAKIAAGAVGTTEIAGESVDLSKLADGSVDATKIVAGAVGENALAVDAVTADQILAGAVGTNELAANSVVAGKIAADSVESTHIVAGAIQTEQLDTGAVNADKIAANAVTTAALNALAVTADKVAANAITAGKIDAGAVTAAKLVSDLILGSRIRLQNTSGATTVDLDGTTGDALIAGELRTALSGERIVVNPANAGLPALYMYPPTGDRFGLLQAFSSAEGGVMGGGVALRGGYQLDDTTTGRLEVYNAGVDLTFGPLGDPNSRIVTFHDNAWVNARNQVSLESAEGSVYIFGLDQVEIGNESGGLTLKVKNDGTRPYIGGNNTNSGVYFGNGRIFITDSNGGAHRPLTCSSLVQSSLREAKGGITDIPFDALDVVRQAPAASWQYRHEIEDGETHTNHMGPMLDDLPSDMWVDLGDDTGYGYDLGSLIGVLWEAVRDLAGQVETLQSQLADRA